MDIQNLILTEVKEVRTDMAALRKEVNTNAKEQATEIKAITSNIHELETQNALHKQQRGYISAAVSAIVAGVISWLVIMFGRQG